jgi:hypothetical protein
MVFILVTNLLMTKMLLKNWCNPIVTKQKVVLQIFLKKQREKRLIYVASYRLAGIGVRGQKNRNWCISVTIYVETVDISLSAEGKGH